MLTAETLRELLNYDPETGVFTWRVDHSRKTRAGARAGCTRPDGYLVIRIRGKLYLGHRLAWMHVHGAWPEGNLDHRDLDKSNCRVMNLRPATQSQNLMNIKSHRDNKTGFKGVTARQDGCYEARICRNYKSISLGFFNCPEEAHAAYTNAAAKYHCEFARSK